MSGKLFLVGTPIGNLKDITLRALEVIKESDIVAAEDTRQTIKLLNYFNIKKAMISYHKFNENDKSLDIIDEIESGKKIALVTDAGMPGISDPGSVIVKKCIEKNIEFEVIPGATALITGLVYSGLDSSKFVFRGFLPRGNKERREIIEEIKDYRDSIIFYEAPHRLKSTLSFLLQEIGDRNVAICKELTKLYENILRGNISEILEYYEKNNPRGEYVIVMEGKSDEEIENEKKSTWEDMTVEEHIKKYMEKGFSKKDAIKLTAKDRGVSKSEIYKASLDI
ncbi:16S rRNA (cytidine1402-2'-O)-methyltransferase [Clostridium acidisoli DSM 12555]|uniref:Ribosomal RNA small subunit methyltransferase I n=1 Tax=Clostridium acidisoli DSM 12555 TaxID=1121291 RepID=A0A1W1XTS5_9CLOT|nr:16S rRNA (cytidine(1402)-2'-O)-methyltransferase [Clostridium acidisoli]SMC27262.1 16S rRNA (cytidine1402-2'-O)-methyltransferase [Clostridium acidisoli DSM 12555]